MTTDLARPQPSRARRLLMGALKLSLVVALLAFVASQLPWRDRLSWTVAGQKSSVQGTIQGDWKVDEVVFQVDPEDLERVSGELVERLREGLPVARSAQLTWQPSMPRVFREVDPSGLAGALGLFVVGLFITAARWWLLLGAAGVHTSWYSALRLTSLGLFFNIVLPGLTGGDLVKAVLAARENPSQRADAVVSVLVDRLLGIGTLVLMGALVVAVVGGELSALRAPLLLALLAGLLGVVVYTSRGLRRVMRVDALVARLPMAATIRKVDEAVLLYSRRRAALALSFLLSVANHASVIAAVLVLSRAFGDHRLGFFDLTAVVSVSNTLSAIPLAPGGWGVGEMAYGYLYELLGSTPALGVAVSVSYRLCMMVIGLAGGIFLLLPGARAELNRIETLSA